MSSLPDTPELRAPGAALGSDLPDLIALLDHYRAILVHFFRHPAAIFRQNSSTLSSSSMPRLILSRILFRQSALVTTPKNDWGSFGIIGLPKGVAGITGIWASRLGNIKNRNWAN